MERALAPKGNAVFKVFDGPYASEVAKKSKTAPPKLADAIGMLQNSGYTAGPTSFDPTGFRTNATFEQITECIL